MSAVRPVAPEPRRRDRARTETNLLNAAQVEFSVHGFKAATTKAIAARAGCSEGLIQNYFGGKEGLLMAVMRSGGAAQPDRFARIFLDRAAASSPEVEMTELLTAVTGIIRSLAPRLRILFDRVLLDPDFARQFADTTPRRALVEGVAARLLRDWPATVEPLRTADAVVSIAFELGFVHPELLGRSAEEVNQYVAHYAALLAHALRSS